MLWESQPLSSLLLNFRSISRTKFIHALKTYCMIGFKLTTFTIVGSSSHYRETLQANMNRELPRRKEDLRDYPVAYTYWILFFIKICCVRFLNFFIMPTFSRTRINLTSRLYEVALNNLMKTLFNFCWIWKFLIIF